MNGYEATAENHRCKLCNRNRDETYFIINKSDKLKNVSVSSTCGKCYKSGAVALDKKEIYRKKFKEYFNAK